MLSSGYSSQSSEGRWLPSAPGMPVEASRQTLSCSTLPTTIWGQQASAMIVPNAATVLLT